MVVVRVEELELEEPDDAMRSVLSVGFRKL
jgi:hypothetical protein